MMGWLQAACGRAEILHSTQTHSPRYVMYTSPCFLYILPPVGKPAAASAFWKIPIYYKTLRLFGAAAEQWRIILIASTAGFIKAR